MFQDTVSLTIRSTIKKIDEISFRCPLHWTIYQLKTFVAMNHQQGQDYFKPTKTHFYFVGALLKDEDTLADILKNKNPKNHYTFIAKFVASLEQENSAKAEEEEYYEREKVIDDYSMLFSDPYGNYKKNTSIQEVDYLSKLPVMADSVSRHLIKKKLLSEEDENKNQEGNNENEEEDDDMNQETEYIIKLVIRILITFFLFRTYFHGVHFYLFIATLVMYFLIKLHQKRVKQRRHERQQRAAAAAAIATQNEARNNAQNPNEQGQGQGQEQNNPENPPPPVNQKRPSFFDRAKELIICFVSSFYPSWDLDLYIENQVHNQAENNQQNDGDSNNSTEDQVQSNKEVEKQDAIQNQEPLNKDVQGTEVKNSLNVESKTEDTVKEERIEEKREALLSEDHGASETV